MMDEKEKRLIAWRKVAEAIRDWDKKHGRPTMSDEELEQRVQEAVEAGLEAERKKSEQGIKATEIKRRL